MKANDNFLLRCITPLILGCTLTACGSGGDEQQDSSTGEIPVVDTQSGDSATNSAPVADNLSVRLDSSLPYVELQLQGRDADNDVLRYVLDSNATGSGYEQAYVDSTSGEFFVTLLGDRNVVEFSYRVTDGSNFSPPATVTVTVDDNNNPRGLGAIEAEVGTYGATPLAYFDGNLYGASPDTLALPRRIDLSANFPVPGDQGRQGSCVAWATGYALKSYQEKIEEGWSFSAATTFSPSFIYNQQNNGRDAGLTIHGALQLLVDKGAATLQTFPYDDQNYLRQPGSAAFAEAANYRARDYHRLEGLSHIKSALANRQPVVIGMKAYQNFQSLFGPSSVYNTIQGSNDGRHGMHAVTVVGYDDDKFGGALKVINSWGTSWGDDGYFWLAYPLVGSVVVESYVLTDAVNTGATVVVPEPPAATSAPNLQVSDWSVEYNPQPGGAGSWQWEITNTGNATGGLGADVNLMLSRDRSIDNSDLFVVYENLPFNLDPGKRAGRYEENPRPFQFPDTLEPGTYYMAVWVDDLGEIAELNERDNVAFGQNTVEFSLPALPDLAIESWYAGWNTTTGDGKLQYRVVNNGRSATTTTDWDINLILSRSPDEARGYYLFFEDGEYILKPGDAVVRKENSAASFNINRSVFGAEIPAGQYYLGLWVDDLNKETEANEINNLSIDNTAYSVGGSRKAGGAVVQTSFNGHRIPTGVSMKMVELLEDEHGNRSFKMLSDEDTPQQTATTEQLLTKSMEAADTVVFPMQGRLLMPAVSSDDGAVPDAK